MKRIENLNPFQRVLALSVKKNSKPAIFDWPFTLAAIGIGALFLGWIVPAIDRVGNPFFLVLQ